MGDQDSIAPRAILGLVAGGIVFLIIHLSMSPAPIAAGPAFVGGALGFFLMRTDVQAMVVVFASVGAGVGVALHRHSHVSGASPFPEVSLLQHLAVEGLIGFGVALAGLLVMGIVMRVMERR